MTIDIVRPLKYETPDECGTEIDFLPTEVNALEDYLAGKGIVFDVSGGVCPTNPVRVYGASGTMWFHDENEPVSGWTLEDLARRIYGRSVADIDPDTDDILTYDSASGGWFPRSPQAIPSASPGFTWGRSGTIPPGTYLQNDGIPSNVAGRTVPVRDSFLTNVFVTCEDATTASFDIQKRDGSTFTTITTVTMSGVRKEIFDFSDLTVEYEDELSVRVSPTSTASPKNANIGIIIRGSTE